MENPENTDNPSQEPQKHLADQIQEEEERIFIAEAKGRYGRTAPLHPSTFDMRK